MEASIIEDDVNRWLEAIYNTDNLLVHEISSRWDEYKQIFINQTAENLYNDLRRTRHLFDSPFTFTKEYARLKDDEKLIWIRFASDIPAKILFLDLRIRKFEDFCRTCLIPYNELEELAGNDYGSGSFHNLPERSKRFYIELNHLIPLELKKIGFEIIRPLEISEINDKLVRKFARAIHSRYQSEMRKQRRGAESKTYISWLHNSGEAANHTTTSFDELPEEIKHSNLDNAFHIPAKLLSIGYKIRPVAKGFKPSVLHLRDEEIEAMAKIEHIRWCWEKILHGWVFGKTRDNREKTHPSIIPYEDLSEPEKEKDRQLVRLIPALLHDIDYVVYPVNTDRISRLPYALKPLSSIHKILDETRDLNSRIRKMVTLTPEIEKIVQSGNRKVEEAIREVESSYNYARHIQDSFFPDNLYIREIFPESFVLFRPRDIVSGDFYFFSKKDAMVIFAAADCTGHGIPGAMLSTIGYGICDQAVNELKITDPPKILKHVYSKMHRLLGKERDRSGVPDDLDIALCTLDTRTLTLKYSGVGNPLYHFSGSGLYEYRPNNIVKGNVDDESYEFVSEKIQLKAGDKVYLFSDGFADQFGGKNHKKYQSGRLKEFLRSISDHQMPEQGDMLYEEIERWRDEKNEDQTDDILVIGIRI